MKKLEYKKFKGLKIYCKNCRSFIHNIKKKKDTNCKHPIELLSYKAILPDQITGLRKTRKLKSLNYDDAVKELIQFKNELKNPIPMALLKQEVIEQPMGLEFCIVKYIDYLCGESEFECEKNKRSKEYTDNMARYCSYFLDFLKGKAINEKTIRVDEISKTIVDEYYKVVRKRTKSNSTFNDTFKPLKGLYRYLIDKRNYPIQNPFTIIPHLDESTNPKSFGFEDIKKIKDIISPEESVEIFSNGKRKNRYKEWLIDAIDLELLTGLRHEPVLLLKWSDVKCGIDGEPEFIISNNLKINRNHNLKGSKPDKFIFLAISIELKELLLRIGLNENGNKDQFIIAPNSKAKRITLTKQMSASFSFFRNKAGVDKDLCFKNLRKTYYTREEIALGKGNSGESGHHSNNKILKNHYIDGAEIAKSNTKRGFKLYDDNQKK